MKTLKLMPIVIGVVFAASISSAVAQSASVNTAYQAPTASATSQLVKSQVPKTWTKNGTYTDPFSGQTCTGVQMTGWGGGGVGSSMTFVGCKGKLKSGSPAAKINAKMTAFDKLEDPGAVPIFSLSK